MLMGEITYTRCILLSFGMQSFVKRALGYGPDEVVARLQGKVQDVRRLTTACIWCSMMIRS